MKKSTAQMALEALKSTDKMSYETWMRVLGDPAIAAIESDLAAKVEPPKMAPVQGYTPGIPWSMHLEAYDVYRKKYGAQQALIEGWCRGGFGTGELDDFIPGWRDRVSEIGKLRAEVKRLEQANAAHKEPAVNAELLGALIKAKKQLELLTPLMQCDENGNGPDCTGLFQAQIDASLAIAKATGVTS